MSKYSFSDAINEEIDKNMYHYNKYLALKKMAVTLCNLELHDLVSIKMKRISSNDEWVKRGCPDTDYILEVEIKVDGEKKHMELIV